MTDPYVQWMRVKPSGDVHAIHGQYHLTTDDGLVLTSLCYRDFEDEHLTSDYPPAAKRCATCTRAEQLLATSKRRRP